MSMWPTEVDYERAESLQDAINGLNGGSKALAGGHSLIPAMKLRLAQPEKLIDIGRIPELKEISANGKLSIGATATHADIAKHSGVQQMCSALAYACGQVGDPAVRNFGTLGGNVAHADPASDPPTVLVAADAVIHLHGANGARSVAARDFFMDLFMTDLQEGELVTSVEIPDLSDKKMAYAKLYHPASHYALVGVCVVLDMNGDQCNSAAVGVGGATVNALRCEGAEAALAGKIIDDATIDEAAKAVQQDIADRVMGDTIYPENYRQAMAGVYLKRAIKQALA